jgi:hypothetical protein
MVRSVVANRNQYRKEIYDFLTNISFNNPLSITLAEKNSDPNNPIIGQRYIDNIKSSINIKHFLNRVNQKVFKNSFRRFGKCLKSFVVMEVSPLTKRHHIHLILEQPDRYSLDKFENVINQSWSETRWGYNHTHIQTMYDNGWLFYLLKDRTKLDLLSDIDWENTHLGLAK